MALVLLALATATRVAAQDPERPLAGRLVVDSVRSAALEGNVLGDPATQSVAVYLPPAYERDVTRRFPVIFLLPPFDGSPTTWTRAWPRLFDSRSGVSVIDSAIVAGRARDVIVVMPNGRNTYHGSFFINSKVTGAWEDFVVRDVVSHVDAGYRTLPHPGSRGVAGHSMGGFAAIRLGMRHPDVFGAVYSLSPPLLAGVSDLASEETWRRVLGYASREELERAYRQGDFFAMVLAAYAAAVTPAPARPPFFAELPYEVVDGALRPVESTLSTWLAAAPIAQLDAHLAALRQLRGLRLDYGNEEQPGIVAGIRRFSDALAARGIPHALEVYAGTHHDRIMTRLGSHVLPFFSEVLAFSAPR